MSLFLTTTISQILVQPGSSGSISVQASYADNVNGASTVTPGYKNTNITNTANTDVAGSPGASTARSVTMTIKNTSATVSNLVTVTHTDGTTIATIYSATLAPGEEAQCQWDGWRTLDVNGATKTAYAQSPALTPLNFNTGTTFTVTSWNSHVRVTSTTAGAKTITGPAATGSMGVIEIIDAGALAANPTGLITFASASAINGPVILSVPTQSSSFRDAASGQIDSV